jgi:hypothetical protein
VGVSEAMKARDGYDLLLTVLFCAGLLAVRRRGRGFGPKIPESDLLVPALSLLGSTGRLWASRLLPGWKALGAKTSFGMGRLYDGASPRALIGRAEGSMFLWTVAASLFAVLTVALLVLVWLG